MATSVLCITLSESGDEEDVSVIVNDKPLVKDNDVRRDVENHKQSSSSAKHSPANSKKKKDPPNEVKTPNSDRNLRRRSSSLFVAQEKENIPQLEAEQQKVIEYINLSSDDDDDDDENDENSPPVPNQDQVRNTPPRENRLSSIDESVKEKIPPLKIPFSVIQNYVPNLESVTSSPSKDNSFLEKRRSLDANEGKCLIKENNSLSSVEAGPSTRSQSVAENLKSPKKRKSPDSEEKAKNNVKTTIVRRKSKRKQNIRKPPSKKLELKRIRQPSIKITPQDLKRITFSDRYSFEIHETDDEAKRASKEGTFKYDMKVAGIPQKKFGKIDLEKQKNDENGEQNEEDKNWAIQNIFETDDPEKFLVLYEGWSADTADFRSLDELKETAPLMLQKCRERASIIRAIEKRSGVEYRPNLVRLRKNPKCSFWILEDLSFFQNKNRKAGKRDQVIFLSADPYVSSVPQFICTNKNLVDRNIVIKLLRNKYSKHINEYLRESRKSRKHGSNPCLSDDCKCESRESMYKNNEHLQNAVRIWYTKDGKLDLNNFDPYLWRFIIECSNECGCDKRCPNRTIQNGQTIPLVVNYENYEKGYGVRAGAKIEKGTLITEYTGEIKSLKENTDDIYCLETYLLFSGFVIDAKDKGNVARFICHSCDPNAIFVEAHSRKRESHPLLPRVGVFAIRNIKKGDEITISYYEPKDLIAAAEDRTKRVKCECNSANCLGWMPTTIL